MKLSQIIIILFISAVILSQKVINDDDCPDGTFKAYTNPEITTDVNYTCTPCNCGTGTCQDFIGCKSCSRRFFLLYNDYRYISRTYSKCQECDSSCGTLECLDHQGCTDCFSKYHTKSTTTTTNEQYNVCVKDSFKFNRLNVVEILAAVLIFCLACFCTTSKKPKKSIIDEQNKEPQTIGGDPSADNQQESASDYQQTNQLGQPTSVYQETVYSQQYNQEQQNQNVGNNNGNNYNAFN